MTKTFVIADTHFGHKNVITFKDNNGEIIRKFDTIEAHDEHLKKCWNEVVKPSDTVYHLGDVVMNKKTLPILKGLNGRKILIKGNHDVFKIQDYLEYFEDIRAYKVLPEGIVMSHIPIHPQSLERWDLNIHGHLHHNRIKVGIPLYYVGSDGLKTYQEDDKKYLCVSVEQTNYYPVDLQKIISERANQLEKWFSNLPRTLN